MDYKITLTDEQEQGLQVEMKRRAYPGYEKLTMPQLIMAAVDFVAQRGIQKIQVDQAAEQKRVDEEARLAREQRDKELFEKLTTLPDQKRATVEALIMQNGS